jgi:hypothetical protein
MPAANAKNIQEWLGLDAQESKHLASVVKNENDPDVTLQLADKLMNANGIEAIRGDYHVDNYYYDIVALYVNTGDTYNGTLLYETEKDRFLVTSYGDWVEANERRYRIS